MGKYIQDQYKDIPQDWADSGTNLIYFGDMHHRKVAPSTRIDEFNETEFNKVAQVRKFAKDFKAKAILQPGDFLDKPKFDEAFLTKVMTAWGYTEMMEARTRYEAGLITKEQYADQTLDYVPIVGLVGNHELYGGSLKTFSRTSLAFLVNAGFINLVDQNNPYLIKGTSGNIAISGSSYDLDLLTEKPDLARYQPTKKFADVDIFMVHEALYNTDLGPGVNWLPIKQVWDSSVADLTLAGHIHTGFGWVEHNDKIFGNPGALAQQSTSEGELTRTVVATLIHIDEENKVHIRDIAIDQPSPKELFDLNAKDQKVEIQSTIKEVQDLMETVEKVSDTSATKIIEAVANQENIEQDVRELAIATTQEAVSELALEEPLDKDADYTISSINLKNFESHANTTIDFPKDKTPTLLIGESSQGKSSVLRAIYWLLENQGDSKQFIRRYKDVNRAEVTLTRNDGLKVTRFIEVRTSKSGKVTPSKNGYEITYPDGTTTETNTEGLSTVRQLFGLTYLQLDAKDQLPINFMKQEDGWYFLGQNAPTRAKIIGALYGTQYIMAAIKTLEANRRSIETQRKVISQRVDDNQLALKPLETAASNKETIDQIDAEFSQLEKDNLLLQKVEDIQLEVNKADKELKMATDTLNELKDLEEVLDQATQIVQDQKTLEALQDACDKKEQATKQIQEVKQLAELDLAGLQEQVDSFIADRNRAVDLKDSYQKILDSNKILQEIKQSKLVSEDLDAIDNSLDKLKQDQDILNSAKETFNNSVKIKEQVELLAKAIENLDKEIVELESQKPMKTIQMGPMSIFLED